MATTSKRVADAVSAIDAALDILVAADLGSLDGSTLSGLVSSIARTESRMAAITARAVAAADDTGALEATGSSSVTTWLADTSGSTTHAASRTVALARVMDAAPAVATGLASGALATDKAVTLARAHDRGVLPAQAVDDLVEDARRLPAGVFAREVRAREAAADNDRLRRDEQWARWRRSVTHRRRADGSVEGRYLLDPLAGDLWLTALRAMGTRDGADVPREEMRTRQQRDADAMAAIAQHSLDSGAGSAELTVRPHVSVVVPVAALAPDGEQAAAAGAVGTTDHGTVLSVQAVRTLLCDAAIRRIVVDPAGTPLDVGRATRHWSGAQRAAAAALDGGCRGPSCDRPFAWTQFHHIDWWSRGGHTDLDRGIPLCHHCHHLVHDDGWTVELDSATRIATWTSPGGLVSTSHPRGPAAPSRLRPVESLDREGPSGASDDSASERTPIASDPDRQSTLRTDRRARDIDGRPRDPGDWSERRPPPVVDALALDLLTPT